MADKASLEVRVTMRAVIHQMLVVSPVQQLDTPATDLKAIQSTIETVEPEHWGKGGTALRAEWWSSGVVEWFGYLVGGSSADWWAPADKRPLLYYSTTLSLHHEVIQPFQLPPLRWAEARFRRAVSAYAFDGDADFHRVGAPA